MYLTEKRPFKEINESVQNDKAYCSFMYDKDNKHSVNLSNTYRYLYLINKLIQRQEASVGFFQSVEVLLISQHQHFQRIPEITILSNTCVWLGDSFL